jgi:hypothetical protein
MKPEDSDSTSSLSWSYDEITKYSMSSLKKHDNLLEELSSMRGMLKSTCDSPWPDLDKTPTSRQQTSKDYALKLASCRTPNRDKLPIEKDRNDKMKPYTLPDHFGPWKRRGGLPVVSKPTSTTKLSTLIQDFSFKTEEQMRQELIAHRIIRLQGADGCFALLRMTAFLGRGYEECMQQTRPLYTSSDINIQSEDVISTAIAVILLQKACALCERLWYIIVDKAMSYVDSRIPLYDSYALYSDLRVLVQDYLRDGKFILSDGSAVDSRPSESTSPRFPTEQITSAQSWDTKTQSPIEAETDHMMQRRDLGHGKPLVPSGNNEFSWGKINFSRQNFY